MDVPHLCTNTCTIFCNPGVFEAAVVTIVDVVSITADDILCKPSPTASGPMCDTCYDYKCNGEDRDDDDYDDNDK